MLIVVVSYRQLIPKVRKTTINIYKYSIVVWLGIQPDGLVDDV